MTRSVPDRDVAMALHLSVGDALCALNGGARQGEREPRPLSDRAVAANRSLVPPPDAIGDRQTESGTTARRLGGKERVVDAREVLGRDARAGISHLGGDAIGLHA